MDGLRRHVEAVGRVRFKKLDQTVQRRMIQAVDRLAAAARPPGSEKLSGGDRQLAAFSINPPISSETCFGVSARHRTLRMRKKR